MKVKKGPVLDTGPFCVRGYYEFVNLSKLFWEAIDSAGNLAIMVLALRNKEC